MTNTMRNDPKVSIVKAAIFPIFLSMGGMESVANAIAKLVEILNNYWILIPGVLGAGILSSTALILMTRHRQNETKHREKLKKIREAQEGKEFYDSLLQNVGEGILLLDHQGRIIYVNQACAAIAESTPDELLGKNWKEIVSEDQHAGILAAYNRRLQRQYDTYEVSFRKRNGKRIHLLISESPDASIHLAQAMLPITPSETTLNQEEGSTQNTTERKTRLLAIRDISDRVDREQELEAVLRVSAALRSPAMREEMLQVIVAQVQELFQAEVCAVLLNRPSDMELIVNAARGNWEHYLGETLQPLNGISSQVNNSRQPYVNNNPLEDPQFAHHTAGLRNISAVACIPLITQQVPIGVLWLGTQAPIEEKDIQLLKSIADIAANSLHRAELYEETQQRIQRLAALRNIDITITASLDLRLTLDILLGQVTSHLNVDAASVLLFNSNLQVLEYVTGNGFRTNTISRSRLRLGEGHAGLAALERRTIHIANLQESGDTSLRRAFISAEGFITYYAIPLIAKGGIKGVLEIFHRSNLIPDPEWLDFLEALATQAAIAIENARLFDDLQRSNMELILAYDATLEGWIHALDLRDKETEGHTQRVTTVTLQLAREVGVSETEMINIRRGALLHDIGKVAIPDSILRKTGPLTPEERAEMEQHPVYAYELLSPITYLQPALDIPYCHHEKWDGTGYPRRLKGEQIPLTARIFAIVDVWDALRSNRPYREAWPEKVVLQYLANESGKHFDPRLLETFLNLLKRIHKVQP